MENSRKIIQFYLISNRECAEHYHQDLDIFYILQGGMKIKIDDSLYELKEGDIIMVNSNKRHYCVGVDHLLAARFQINYHLLADYMGTLQMMFWCNTTVDRNEAYNEVREILDHILEHYYKKNDRGELYLNSLYYRLLHVLTSNFMVKADDIRVNFGNTQDYIRVRYIQNYIQANYHMQISLNDLAEQLYLSNTYLSKYIKKHLGLSFMEYLNNIRLYHAVDEMMYTNKNLTKIALDNGFTTSAAFTKAFREAHGEVPSKYRSRLQMPQDTDCNEEELDEKNKGLIQKYIRFRDENVQKEKERPAHAIDMERFIATDASWANSINIGNLYMLLQTEVQTQLKKIQRETGVRYVKICNIFSWEHCYDEARGVNFWKMDQALDFIIDNHMKPYIELSINEEPFRVTLNLIPEDKMISGEDIMTYEDLIEIVKLLYMHLINRYGLEELETWYFSCCNEPYFEIDRDEGEYYRYFEKVYQIFKEINPNVRIGVSGIIIGCENELFQKAVKILKKKKIKPDFISFSSFQYMILEEEGHKYGRKSIDSNFIRNQMESICGIMKKEDFQVQELHIGAWNFTANTHNVFNDSCEHAAYIMKTCINMQGMVNLMIYWHGLDVHSEAGMILTGDSGILSRDSIRKPSFYAFQFISKLQPNIVYRDENSIITSNGRGHFVIACHNFKKMSSKYVFSDEEKILIDDIEQYMEDTDSLNVNFRLENVKQGIWMLKIYYLNKENGSAQDIWKMMEYRSSLSKDEIEYIRQKTLPNMETRTLRVENDVMEIENMLLAQEIRLLDIQYQDNV